MVEWLVTGVGGLWQGQKTDGRDIWLVIGVGGWWQGRVAAQAGAGGW